MAGDGNNKRHIRIPWRAAEALSVPENSTVTRYPSSTFSSDESIATSMYDLYELFEGSQDALNVESDSEPELEQIEFQLDQEEPELEPGPEPDRNPKSESISNSGQNRNRDSDWPKTAAIQKTHPLSSFPSKLSLDSAMTSHFSISSVLKGQHKKCASQTGQGQGQGQQGRVQVQTQCPSIAGSVLGQGDDDMGIATDEDENDDENDDAFSRISLVTNPPKNTSTRNSNSARSKKLSDCDCALDSVPADRGDCCFRQFKSVAETSTSKVGPTTTSATRKTRATAAAVPVPVPAPVADSSGSNRNFIKTAPETPTPAPSVASSLENGAKSEMSSLVSFSLEGRSLEELEDIIKLIKLSTKSKGFKAEREKGDVDSYSAEAQARVMEKLSRKGPFHGRHLPPPIIDNTVLLHPSPAPGSTASFQGQGRQPLPSITPLKPIIRRGPWGASALSPRSYQYQYQPCATKPEAPPPPLKPVLFDLCRSNSKLQCSFDAPGRRLPTPWFDRPETPLQKAYGSVVKCMPADTETQRQKLIYQAVDNGHMYRRIKNAQSSYQRNKQLTDFKRHQAFLRFKGPVANMAAIEDVNINNNICIQRMMAGDSQYCGLNKRDLRSDFGSRYIFNSNSSSHKQHGGCFCFKVPAPPTTQEQISTDFSDLNSICEDTESVNSFPS